MCQPASAQQKSLRSVRPRPAACSCWLLLCCPIHVRLSIRRRHSPCCSAAHRHQLQLLRSRSHVSPSSWGCCPHDPTGVLCAWPNQALPNAVPRLCEDKKRGAHPEENADGRNRPRSRRRRPVKETNKKKRRWGRRTRRAHVRSLPRPASGKRRDNSRRWRFGAAAFGWHGMMRRTRVGTPGAQAGHGTHPPIARRQERSESWALLFLWWPPPSLCVSLMCRVRRVPWHGPVRQVAGQAGNEIDKEMEGLGRVRASFWTARRWHVVLTATRGTLLV